MLIPEQSDRQEGIQMTVKSSCNLIQGIVTLLQLGARCHVRSEYRHTEVDNAEVCSRACLKMGQDTTQSQTTKYDAKVIYPWRHKTDTKLGYKGKRDDD